MKGTLKKKIVAVFVAVFMLSTIFVTNAFALGTTISGEYDENGNMVYGSIEGTDDDNVADIDVQAKVTEYNAAVYKIDIAWGAMQFEFQNDANNWDPVDHEYKAEAGTNKKWIIDGYVNGENNKITLTNHSNARVNAAFDYAHVKNDAFNADFTSDNAVRGHFFLTNNDAVTAAGILENSATVENTIDSLELHHSDSQELVDQGYHATENTRSVYFTLNGTPDTEKVAGYTDFKKVGTITVTITPTVITQ